MRLTLIGNGADIELALDMAGNIFLSCIIFLKK